MLSFALLVVLASDLDRTTVKRAVQNAQNDCH